MKNRRSDADAHIIPNRIDIAERPKEVDTRVTFGHRETDTVVGPALADALHEGALITVVERKTRTLVCRAVAHRTKIAAGDAIVDAMRDTNEHVNGQLRKYYSKGRSLRDVDPFYLQVNVGHLNRIPRAMLDFASPQRLFEQELGALTTPPPS